MSIGQIIVLAAIVGAFMPSAAFVPSRVALLRDFLAERLPRELLS